MSLGLAFCYQYIYLLVVSILTFAAYSKYFRRMEGEDLLYSGSSAKNAYVVALFFALFIGLRPKSGVFVDMMNYDMFYSVFYFGKTYNFSWDAENFLFDNLFHLLGSLNVPIVLFFVLMALIYFMLAYFAIKRLFPDNELAVYLVFLGAFSTFSYGTNGIKAGAAVSVFMLALSYRDRLLPCSLLMLASIGMHHSMKLPVVAFVLTLFLKNPKYYFYGWLFSVLMAIGNVNFFQNFFSQISGGRGAGYLNPTLSETAYVTGFRPDFLLYSAIPIWVGYVAKFKKGIQSRMYDTLLYTYITTNAIWVLCMNASFTNRIAYLSWGIYPIVLVYPFLNEAWGDEKYQLFAKVMIGHLAFTLFMEMIYYGGLMKLFF